MRNKEFIKRVEELGFGAWITGNSVYISKGNDEIIARVEVDKTLSIDFTYSSARSLEEEIKGKLFDLVVEYAKTPVKDREEEKKFRLKHRRVTSSVWYLYLYRDEDGIMGVSRFTEEIENQELGKIQVKFTLKEIEEIKEKFDTDLADFELVEVVDEE